MDSTYAPQSPDLSSYLSSPPKTRQPYNTQPTQPQSSSSSSSYAPRSPGIPSFNTQPGARHAFSSNQNQFAYATDGANDFAEYGSTTYMTPIPALPSAHSDFHAQLQPQSPLRKSPASILDSHASSAYGRPHRQARNNIASYSDDFEPPEQAWEQEQGQSITSPLQTQPQSHQQDLDLDPYQQPLQPQQSMFSRGPRIKPDISLHNTNTMPSLPAYNPPNPLNIEIRTKFPVARIKRIMQADEEVGKVAQVTPVAVSKALELFMIALVGGAAVKAKDKGGKKVTAQHLKSVVLGSDQFDFLAEIVGRVAEVQEGAGGEGRKRKGKASGAESGKEEKESESSEEEKKPKKGRGRRKKSDE